MQQMRLLSALVLLSLLALSLPASAKPLQIYILAGQSNMQGHAKVSTFEHIGMDPATSSPEEFRELINADAARWSRVVKALNLNQEQK